MGRAIEELARFVPDAPWETIPETMQEHAKLVLLDMLGAMLAGSVQPEVAGARSRLTATGGVGATVYAPGWPTTDPRTAALLKCPRYDESCHQEGAHGRDPREPGVLRHQRGTS